jgi:thymidylate synthase ThyX
MPHCIVPAAEELLDREFPVLDKGFVRLVDYMGGDARIVQAARVSYGAGHEELPRGLRPHRQSACARSTLRPSSR